MPSARGRLLLFDSLIQSLRCSKVVKIINTSSAFDAHSVLVCVCVTDNSNMFNMKAKVSIEMRKAQRMDGSRVQPLSL